MDKTIVLASSNPGKVREISQMLVGLDFSLRPQSDFNVEDIPETGLSFVENALLKARNAARQTSLPTIADDSGIAVDALDGAPGIYSARYAGEGATDEENLYKLIATIEKTSENRRDACFVCVMVYVRHADDPMPVIAEGIWHGQLVTEPCGENGFGYDPIFYLPDHQCTSAELSPETKNQISHRSLALKQLLSRLSDV